MSTFVYVQPHLRLGGAERQTVLTANALVDRGHDVVVVLHVGGGALVEHLHADVRVHVLGLGHHAGVLEIARRLAAVLRRLPPALVIVKLWSSIVATALVDHLAGTRHHAVNYCEDLDPTDHAGYIRLGAVKQRLVRHVFRSRPLLSANTQTVADSMVDVYGLRSRPAVIPSTVDPDRIRAAAAARPESRGPHLTVVSVGSLITRKGLDVTRAALTGLDEPVHWRIVGEGPLAPELRRWAAAAPPGMRISLEGGHPEPYGFMAAADVLVHSAWSEAWGIVLLEAMSVGTPVVATQAIGAREMQRVLGPRPALLRTVPVGDVGAVRDAVAAVRRDRRPTPDEGSRYVRPFTVDRAADLWERRAVVAGVPR